MKSWKLKKLVALLVVLAGVVSCGQDTGNNKQPIIIADEDVKQYWRLDDTDSYWEINKEGVVNFLSCSVKNGYVKDLNVTGRIDGDFIVVDTQKSPTMDLTTSNSQMVISEMKHESEDTILEIPKYTVVSEIPEQCNESIIHIANLSIDQLKLNTENEISVNVDFRLEEASADVYVAVIPSTSDVFEQPSVPAFSITQAGTGSENIKINYKPDSVAPHFLYVFMIPESQLEQYPLQSYLIDLQVIEVES